ncbi:AzlC family ABC transporter permease [Streptomyces sp. HNM0574]|uniref:AzlC family ABC transporter permease n=1 Tax=Streptomyces sp. HNM0574 TaxID=2714954 RepID=UPI00146CC841|nr:AzlC family ABC transporter permease [Streptomyces sp. HNM0574]NLU67337.1 AzlC family ABC transporter permease [Streptomyces sp. HNM0574]
MTTSVRAAEATGAPEAPPEQRTRSDLALAFRDTSSVGLGLFPLGIAFGVLVVHSGLPWWWAVLCTALVYAGSLEFLLVGLVLAAVPLAQVALTAFLVNFRHVFYALSFPLHRVRSKRGKAYGTFSLTDEAYALTATEPAAPQAPMTGGRILWLQFFCHAYWVTGAVAGALLGGLIPDAVVGLEFALTALFVVLAIDGIRARRDIPTPVLALLSSVVAAVVLPDQMLVLAMALFVGSLVVRYVLTGRGGRGPAADEPAGREQELGGAVRA